MSQTSYSNSAPLAVAGQPFDNDAQVESFRCESAVKNGVVVQLGSTHDEVKYIAAIADDADSILATGGASAAAAQTVSGAALNGTVYGLRARISPAQRVSMTLNSHTDWDATVATVFGEDVFGNKIEDDVAIPNGGNTTVSTKKAFARVDSIDIPAQTGTNGTFTVGTLNDDEMVLDRADYPGIPVYDAAKEPATGTVITGVDADHDTYDSIGVCVKGRIWVIPEAAVTRGMPVYVRMTESGTDIMGQVRGTPATGFARYPGAFFVTASDADALAVVELV